MKYYFISAAKGEFEGTNYDFVRISDGLRPIKCQNHTGKSDFTFKEGDEVKVDLEVRGGKDENTPSVRLLSISK